MLHALQWSCCGIKVEHKKVNRKCCNSSFALHSKKVKRDCLQHFVFSPEALAFYLGVFDLSIMRLIMFVFKQESSKKRFIFFFVYSLMFFLTGLTSACKQEKRYVCMLTLERCTREKDGVRACHWQEHNFVQILKILGRGQQGNPSNIKGHGPSST
jgi:hypothetical protein